MIENKQEISKDLEKALQVLQQAKQRVANEKKKQNEKKRKAENHHKYIMGGIIMKYFPDCYHYDEEELNRILSVALQTKECQQIISKIIAESRETTPPPNVPKEYADRATLWNSVELSEKGQKSQLARMLKASLPNEWSYELADEDVLLVFEWDCLNLSVYNLTENMKEMAEKIVLSEGFFCWKGAD